MMPAVKWSPRPGKRREIRKLVERDIHPERRAFAAPMREMLFDLPADRALGNQPVEQQLGIDARDDGRRTPGLAAGNQPGCTALLDDDLADRRIQHDVDARLMAGLGHRLGDGSHAADGVAPGARNAGRLAEQVMEQDISGARRIGRSEIPDDAVKCEQRLGQIALEEAIEDIARAFRGELVDGPDFVGRKPDEVAPKAGQLRQAAQPRARFGRRLQDPFADQRDDRVELFMIAVIGRAIGRHVPRDFRAGQPVAARQAGSFRSARAGNCRACAARPSGRGAPAPYP